MIQVRSTLGVNMQEEENQVHEAIAQNERILRGEKRARKENELTSKTAVVW